ncbi:MAG: hypothetical protein N2257_08520 [Thermodesulfovibrionales bacterium]|nr:hypothetical protein [Thermodesulfovibrionales bacterium]
MKNDFENTKIKEAASYNIAALNAILGNEDEAIKWLRYPLMQDKRLWLEKIQNDRDFDAIRKRDKFSIFLNEYKQ